MKQTIQSHDFAKKSNTPVMFVATKIDQRDANLDLVNGSIYNYFNTDEIYPISAKTGENVQEMLMFLKEKISELNLRETIAGHPEGHILEVKTQPGIGTLCTVLTTRGIFKQGRRFFRFSEFVYMGYFFSRYGVNLKPKKLFKSEKIPLFRNIQIPQKIFFLFLFSFK